MTTMAIRGRGAASATGSNPAAAIPQGSGQFWIAGTLAICILIPVQAEVMGLMLSPTRLFLLGVTPYLLVRWIRGDFGRHIPDYLIFFFAFWFMLSMLENHGMQRMVGYGGSNALTFVGSYLVGRAAIRSAADLRRLAKLLAILTMAFLLPMALYETFLIRGSPILQFLETFDWLTHYGGADVSMRLGLNRAQVTLAHPIHYGIFCSLAFATFYAGMVNHLSHGRRLLMAAMIGFTSCLSVSSGPVGSIGFQIALLGFVMTFHKAEWQWKAFRWGGIALYILLELNTTKFAFFTLAEKIALNPHNAYTRQIMIRTAGELMERYPLFGIGLHPWPLPFWMRYSNSIDNYWAVLAGSHGTPTFLAALAAFAYPLIRAGRTGFRKGSDLYWARVSWSITIGGILLVAATVHLFSTIVAAIYMFLGAGIFLLDAREPQDGAPVAGGAPARRRGPVYTRFPTAPAE